MPTSNITLAWDANTEPDIAGYKIYAGRTTGVYDAAGSPKDVGNVTSGFFTINSNGFWFFSLTAYDTEGLESGFSNEVSRSWFLASNFP